jgi:type IV secretion system protein VirD4
MIRSDQGSVHFPSLVIVSGLLAWGCVQVGPLYAGGELQWLTAALYGCTALAGLHLVIESLRLLARYLEWVSAHQATGKDGTAIWAKDKDIRKEQSHAQSGPFWGRMASGKKTPIFSDYASNALTVAPAGSGKGIYSVIPNGLSIQASKVFSDFKGELVSVLKKALEKRGETVGCLIPADCGRTSSAVETATTRSISSWTISNGPAACVMFPTIFGSKALRFCLNLHKAMARTPTGVKARASA